MRVWALLGLLVMVLLPVEGRAEATCPRPNDLSAFEFDFHVYEPRLVFRHDVDLLGLPRVEGHMETPPNGWTLQGLTITSDQLEIHAGWKEYHLSDGHVCLWINKLQVTVGMPEQRVYVAANYPEGSCEYNAILSHERQHVAINREVVQTYAGSIRQSLVSGVRDINPIMTRGSADGPAVLRRLQSAARPDMQAMQAELHRRNGAIDTPDAYRRQQQLAGCSHWQNGRGR